MGRRKPLTVALLRAATERAAAPLPVLDKIVAALPQAIVATVGQLGDAPAKVSVEGMADAPATPAAAHRLRFVTSRGEVGGFIAIEPTLVFALCDSAMGGSGTEPPFESEGRPLSNIEVRLSRMFMSLLGDQLAVNLGEAMGLEVQTAAPDTGGESPSQGYRLFRCLVSLLGQSGETTVGFGRRDLETLTGIETPGATVTFRRHIPTIALHVEVRTRCEIMPLAEVRAISPGRVFHLATRIDDPVAVFASDRKLFDGRMARDGAGLSINLL